mmetsp:Transcript_4368/g.15149  ORF Transcript_4368/g.15149 Transcript_4368/m.15149 type:complete len:146 (-) Transcript_4368:750-1187(-)
MQQWCLACFGAAPKDASELSDDELVREVKRRSLVLIDAREATIGAMTNGAGFDDYNTTHHVREVRARELLCEALGEARVRGCEVPDVAGEAMRDDFRVEEEANVKNAQVAIDRPVFVASAGGCSTDPTGPPSNLNPAAITSNGPA